MTYSVKEIFYTLQGEGFHTGRPAVFCRFSGCNLWSGLEEDRKAALCQFCDTDFIGTDGINGGKFDSAAELANAVSACWPEGIHTAARPFIVCTGGEPLLQLDETLIHEFHLRGFEVAVETNGTRSAPEGIDWICVSPKKNMALVLERGNELKVVFPQEGLDLEQFDDLLFDHRYIQPKDDENIAQNTQEAINLCLSRPNWSLSLQTHKILGLK